MATTNSKVIGIYSAMRSPYKTTILTFFLKKKPFSFIHYLFDAFSLKNVGKLAHFLMQLPIGDLSLILRVVSFPVKGYLQNDDIINDENHGIEKNMKYEINHSITSNKLKINSTIENIYNVSKLFFSFIVKS